MTAIALRTNSLFVIDVSGTLNTRKVNNMPPMKPDNESLDEQIIQGLKKIGVRFIKENTAMTTQEQKHTPTPWKVTPTLGDLAIAVPSQSIGLADTKICNMWHHLKGGNEEAEANAQFIVTACNEYAHNKQTIEELVNTVKFALEMEEMLVQEAIEEKNEIKAHAYQCNVEKYKKALLRAGVKV